MCRRDNFLYISLLPLHDYGVELPDFTFYRELNFYIYLSLNLDMVLRSSTPRGVAYFGQSKVE